MSALTYHLENENPNGKNYFIVRLRAPRPISNKESLLSLAATPSEKSALEFLLKEHTRLAAKMPPQNPLERLYLSSFDALKMLGTTGKLFNKDKKVVVDPFSAFELFFEAEKLQEDIVVSGRWKMGATSGVLEECDLLFLADPSWALKNSFIRPFKDDTPLKWIRFALQGPKRFKPHELPQFLEQIEDEVSLVWKGEKAIVATDPLPILMLSDRHGGFADLWFDYGPHGNIAMHDPATASWRSRDAEKMFERDLFETDFKPKIVDQSHYYCPLDKVAKSLTFLLEVGWTIVDARGRKVVRQKKVDFDAEIGPQTITLKAKMHYDDHRVDLKDMVGAFNRRENFVELSQNSVALLDRENFSAQWGDFAEEEITSEGIVLKKNRFGMLQSLFEEQNLPVRPELRAQVEKMAGGQPGLPIDPAENFQGTLFSYQKDGLQWLQFLSEGGFGGLLADEMGLGKTVQVLAFFSRCLITRPFLIVVPTSLLFNWQREIEKFLPGLPVYRHEGKDRQRTLEALNQPHVTLTSYALLRLDADLLQSIDYQIVVLDEAQAIKNPESQVASIASRLKADMRLAITGTPIENRSDDLWSIFRFLLPDLLGERRRFQSEMTAAQADKRYLERLKRKIRPFILRRKKEHVALQLPPKLEQTIFVEMTEPQRQVYERWLQSTKQGLLKKVSLDGISAHRMEILEAILRLRQLCVHPWLVEERQEEDPAILSSKFERLMADLQEVVDENSKVLVYSQFTEMLRLIEGAVKQKGWKYVYLDGSSKDREQSVKQFQEDPETAIFLISLKAGGVGLNLTAADYVFLYDPWWNEAVERQAIDRAHRLGKTGTVIARRYITALSIEEKILRLKTHKTALSQSLLDSEGTAEAISLEDLLQLLD